MTDAKRLEQKLQDDKLAFRETLAEIGDRTEEAVDWRAQYRKHPAAVLGAVAAAGVLLGMNSGRSRAPAPAPSEQDAEPAAEPQPGLRQRADRFVSGTVQRSVASVLAVKVMGIAEEAFMQWLRTTLTQSRRRPPNDNPG